MQNRLPMRLYLPHIVQGEAGSVSASAHLVQNGVRTLFEVWHLAQVTSLVTRCASRSRLNSRAEKYRSLTSSDRLILSSSKNQRYCAGSGAAGSASCCSSSLAV